MSHLESTEEALTHLNIINNNYRQDLRASYTFVPNKSFSQLLDVSPKLYSFKIF